MSRPGKLFQSFKIAAVIVIVVVIVYLLVMTGPRPGAEKNAGYKTLVSVLEVEPTDKSPQLPLFGYVESPQTATLTAAVSGDVVNVLVSEGDRIEEGQDLVLIDDVDLQLSVQDREADLKDITARITMELRQYKSDQIALEHEKRLKELAQENLSRAEKLFKKRLGSEKALDDASTAFEQQSLSYNARSLVVANHSARLSQLKAQQQRAESALERAKRDLARATIKAPFSGQIAAVNVSRGDRVGPGSKMVSIYDHNRLEVRAQIPVRYLEAVRDLLARGQSVEATTQVDGKQVRLTLDRLSGEARRGTAGIPGLFVVNEGSEELVLGRFINFSVELPPVGLVVELPYEAIYGANKVYKYEDGVMRPVIVERVGETHNKTGQSAVLVKSAEIVKGDRIIITQVPNAMDGRKVKLASNQAGE